VPAEALREVDVFRVKSSCATANLTQDLRSANDDFILQSG
jgi:hypothetical protein